MEDNTRARLENEEGCYSKATLFYKRMMYGRAGFALLRQRILHHF
jgi:hypothetical protein